MGSKREKTALNEAQKRRRESGKTVKFITNVMLLEAAARNDIEEGMIITVTYNLLLILSWS